MKSTSDRAIDYMRVSVTDRCSLRCKYCMPYRVECVPRWDILSLEGIRAVGICAVNLGICHIKVAGGEPLARRDYYQLVKQLKSIPGIKKVTVATNGIPLERYPDDLMETGMNGINISLDTLDGDLYQGITGASALGIVTGAARWAYTMPSFVRINAVSIDFSQIDEEHREAGQDGWRQMVELVREYPVDVRFIEMISVGHDRNFKTIDYRELLEEMMKAHPCIEEDDWVYGFGPAAYYRIPGFKGNTGLIGAIHGKLCSGCNQVRLTSQGYLKPCLCYEDGVDLRRILRKGRERSKKEGYYRWPYAGYPSDGGLQRELGKAMEQAVLHEPAAHCFGRPDQTTEAYNVTVTGR